LIYIVFIFYFNGQEINTYFLPQDRFICGKNLVPEVDFLGYLELIIPKLMMQNKPQVIEKSILKSALKYRGSMNISEYQNYAAGILFLKKMNHAFESEREKLISEYLSQEISETKAKELAENENEYSKSFFLPKIARWASIRNFQSQIGEQLNQATKSVEKMNPFLDGLLVGIDFSKLSDKKLKNFIEHISHCSRIAPVKKSLDYIDYYEKVKKSSANSVHKNGLISSVMSYVYQNRHSGMMQFLIQNVKEYTYKNGIKPSTLFKLSLAQRNKPTYEKYEQILTQRRYQRQTRWQEIDVVYLWVDPNDLNWQTDTFSLTNVTIYSKRTQDKVLAGVSPKDLKNS